MEKIVQGAKAGSGSSRTARIQDDSASSTTQVRIVYGLCEGVIKGVPNGLRSIYLDDTPIQNVSGESNFNDVIVDYRLGENDQAPLAGFPDVSNETSVNVELKTQWAKSITNTELDAISVRLTWGALRTTNSKNGDVTGVTIKYAIDLSTDGGSYETVLDTQISDKTSANYERTHKIVLPSASSGWTVRVRRITPEAESEYISDKMYVDAISEIVDVKFSYPNTAVLGLQYDAETFSSIAKLAVEAEGTEILVPSNYDAETRQYSGLWDGSFKRSYSNNPAWVFYDLCTNSRYGLGKRVTQAMIDKASLYRLAQYCDGEVSDGVGGTEPRFTCNVYIQSTEDAYAILTKLAGVFRAISYWDGDSIVCDADAPQDPCFAYSRANVIDGVFEYSGTRARDRHTVAKVAWDNPENRYKTEYELVRDDNAIAKLGVNVLSLDAWGCTSRGQAQRAGHWALLSEQLETRSVTFKVGLDGFIPMVGKVIEVSDNLFAGRANGGRVSAISADGKVITLDREVITVAGDTLVINGEDGQAIRKVISSVSGNAVTLETGFDVAKIAVQNVWVIDSPNLATMKFRVVSLTQDSQNQFTITATQYNSGKYGAIDSGAYINDAPISIVNPKSQAPVSNVTISSYDKTVQGMSVSVMVIKWVKADLAVKYLVEWKKDDGTWVKMPLTGNTSVEVDGVYAGDYLARVTAISAFDSASLPVTSSLTTLSGKVGAPPVLASFTATGILFGMQLDWAFPSVGALDTEYVEIMENSIASDEASQLLGLFAYPTNTKTIQGLSANVTRYYKARIVDKIGNKGEWTDWVSGTSTVDANDVLEMLSGQITVESLSDALNNSIDSVIAKSEQLSIEMVEQAEALAIEAQTRADAIAIEAQTRADEIANESAQRSLLAQETAQQLQEQADALEAEATQRATDLQAQSDELTAQITAERNARLEAIDTLDDGLTAEITARENGDQKSLNALNNYKVSNDNALANVQGQIDVAVADGSASASAIQALDTRLTDAEGDVTALSSAVSNTYTKAQTDSVVAGRINSFQTSFVVPELNKKATTTALNILDSKVTTVDGKVSSNTSNITALSGRVTTAENAISTKADSSALNNYYTKTQADTAIAGSISSFKAGLSVGSTNLLTGTSKEKSNYSFSGGWGHIPTRTIPAQANTNYTIRAYIENASTSVNRVRVMSRLLDADSNTIKEYFGTIIDPGVSGYSTLTVNSEGAAFIQAIAIRSFTGSGGASGTYSEFKLERGDFATDWSPSPKDVSNSLDANATAIQDTNTTVSNLAGTVASNSSSITSLNNTLSTVQSDLSKKANSSALSALDSRVSQTESSLSSQSNSITTLSNDIAELDDLTSLQNTQNIIQDPYFVHGDTFWGTLSGWEISTQGRTGLCLRSLGSVNTATAYPNPSNIQVQEGEVWRIKYWAYISADFNGNGGNTKVSVRNKANGVLVTQSAYDTITKDQWVEVKKDITIPSGVAEIYLDIRRNGDTGVVKVEGFSFSNVSDLVLVEQSAQANGTALSGLTSRVSSAEGTITSQGASITALNNALTVTNTEVAKKATTSALNTLDSKVTSVDGKVTANAGEITTLKSSVTALQNQDASLATAISNVYTKAEADSALSTQVNSLNASLSKIPTGSNLIPNGSFEDPLGSQWVSWGAWTRVLEGRNSGYCLTATQSTTAVVQSGAYKIQVSQGQTYSCTVWARKTTDWNGNSGNTKVSFRDSAGVLLTQVALSGAGQSWTKFTTDVTIPADMRLLYVDLRTNHTVGQIWVDDLSFENVTQLTEAESQIALKADTSALQALDARVDSVDATLTSTVSSVTQLNNGLTNLSNEVATKATLSALNNLSTQVTAIDGEVDAVSSSLTKLETSIAGGNENLLVGTGTPVTSSSSTGTNQGSALYHFIATQEEISNRASTRGNLTISFDWEYVGSNPSGYFRAQLAASPFTTLHPNIHVNSSNTSGRVEHAMGSVSWSGTNKMVVVRRDNMEGAIKFSNMKIEFGSIATAWSLAPQEVATAQALDSVLARVVTAEGTIVSESNKLSTLTNTVNDEKTKTANNSSAIGLLNSSVSSINGQIASVGNRTTLLETSVDTIEEVQDIPNGANVILDAGYKYGLKFWDVGSGWSFVETGGRRYMRAASSQNVQPAYPKPRHIPVSVGQVWRFKFNLFLSTGYSGGANSKMSVRNSNGNELIAYINFGSTTGQWVTLSTDYTIPAGVSSIFVDFRKDSYDHIALIDGVEVVNVTELKALETEVATKASSSALNTLEARTTTIEGTTTSQANEITQLKSNMTNVQNSTSSQGSAISGLTSRVSNAEGNISNASNQLTSLNSSVSLLDKAVELPSSSNAVLDPKFLQGSAFWSMSGWSVVSTPQGNALHINNLGSGGTAYPKPESIPVTPGQVWRLRALVCIDSSFNGTSGNTKLSVRNSGSLVDSVAFHNISRNAWRTISKDITIPSDITSVSLDVRADGTTGKVWVTNLEFFNVTDLVQKADATALQVLDTKVTTIDGKVSSQASQITTLTSDNSANKNALQVQATVIDGVQANYMVKMETNGVIGGFGLMQSTGALGQVVTTFGVNADNFFIGAPSGGKKPFIQTTTSTVINGVTVPAGTYIDTAYIGNSTIGTAHINDLAVTTAKIGNGQITTAKIGDLQVDTLKIAGSAVTVTSVITYEEYVSPRSYFENSAATVLMHLKRPNLIDEFKLWLINPPIASVTLNPKGGSVQIDVSSNAIWQSSVNGGSTGSTYYYLIVIVGNQIRLPIISMQPDTAFVGKDDPWRALPSMLYRFVFDNIPDGTVANVYFGIPNVSKPTTQYYLLKANDLTITVTSVKR